MGWFLPCNDKSEHCEFYNWIPYKIQSIKCSRNNIFGIYSKMVVLKGIRNIIIANFICFTLQLILRGKLEMIFGLVPSMLFKGYVYQLFTYMFLHGDFFHILMNMYALWLFGSELEFFWGTKEFYKYYFITGIGAGIIYSIFNFHSDIPVIGASGAVFGILLAFGMLFPERELLIIFPIPLRIKAKIFVFVIGGLEIIYLLSGSRGIAHLAHLGGLFVGFIYLRWKRRRLY
uniref:Rhomboid family intramembrane serine protease n=1 Tax=candidate division WOR-3 bacterium TaxID=2052148 RepID=A0A7C3YS43_UNCW3